MPQNKKPAPIKPSHKKPVRQEPALGRLQQLNQRVRLPVLLPLLAIAIILAVVLVWRQVSIHQEAGRFHDLQRQVYGFADEVAKLGPSTVSKISSCSYSSAKFSKGYLSCGSEAVVEFKPPDDMSKITSQIDILQKDLRWKFSYDNTGQKDSSTRTYLKILVYSKGAATCGVDYKYKTNNRYPYEPVLMDGKPTLQIQVSCTGPAKAEYFPVKAS